VHLRVESEQRVQLGDAAWVESFGGAEQPATGAVELGLPVVLFAGLSGIVCQST